MVQTEIEFVNELDATGRAQRESNFRLVNKSLEHEIWLWEDLGPLSFVNELKLSIPIGIVERYKATDDWLQAGFGI